VVLEQLQHRQDDVVHVAEAGGLRLLAVVEAARPVDRDVGRAVVEPRGAADRAARVELTVAPQTGEGGAVLKHVEAREVGGEGVGALLRRVKGREREAGQFRGGRVS
jgi:hypothetical protein